MRSTALKKSSFPSANGKECKTKLFSEFQVNHLISNTNEK